MRKGNLIFCIFLIAVSAYAVLTATGWSFKTKLFPLAVSIPLVTLLVIQLLLMIGGKEETGESGAMDIDFTVDVPSEVARQRVGVEAFDVQQHSVRAQRAEGRTGGRQCRLDRLQRFARMPEVRKGVRKRRPRSERRFAGRP